MTICIHLVGWSVVLIMLIIILTNIERRIAEDIINDCLTILRKEKWMK